MNNIEELSRKATAALIFEPITTPVFDVTISPTDSTQTYKFSVPKLFLKEFARLVIEEHTKTLNV